jgi:hypothetical protein
MLKDNKQILNQDTIELRGVSNALARGGSTGAEVGVLILYSSIVAVSTRVATGPRSLPHRPVNYTSLRCGTMG